jgi:hypothetical protein
MNFFSVGRPNINCTDGQQLEYKIPELNSIGQARLDARELG